MTYETKKGKDIINKKKKIKYVRKRRIRQPVAKYEDGNQVNISTRQFALSPPPKKKTQTNTTKTTLEGFFFFSTEDDLAEVPVEIFAQFSSSYFATG